MCCRDRHNPDGSPKSKFLDFTTPRRLTLNGLDVRIAQRSTLMLCDASSVNAGTWDSCSYKFAVRWQGSTGLPTELFDRFIQQVYS